MRLIVVRWLRSPRLHRGSRGSGNKRPLGSLAAHAIGCSRRQVLRCDALRKWRARAPPSGDRLKQSANEKWPQLAPRQPTCSRLAAQALALRPHDSSRIVMVKSTRQVAPEAAGQAAKRAQKNASNSSKKLAAKLPKVNLNFIRPIARRVRRLKAKRANVSQHSLQMKQVPTSQSSKQPSTYKLAAQDKPKPTQSPSRSTRQPKQQQPPPPSSQQTQQEDSVQSPIASKISSSYQSVFNLNRLKKDGRKTPDHYRQTIQAAQSPSQLSIKSITEYYQLQPDSQFVTAQDVFHYRGYKKLNKIDEGAFGVVSKAIRLADKRVVAVKEVDLRRKRAKRIEEMKRELFMLQKVNHENVVELIEHFIIGQMLVIVMEFCAGNNLTAYLKETAINEQEARFLFKQMALSIKVLHKKGFSHRDVKLNNFLLDSTRRIVKVSDFGLSVVSYRRTYGILMAKTYCGTEPYMAPEILKRNSLGQRQYNPIYADIWSLGVCLFAMLTRTFPFKMHTSQQGLFRAQVARRWRFPRSLRDILSEEIKDLVSHMLDPEPDRRINITGVMHHPWLNQNQLVVMSFEEFDPFETTSQHNA